MSNTDRRDFLKGGAAAALAATALPSIFARALLAGEPGDRVLVLVQLDGGNDGLNTVVPFGDDAYYRSRPGIGIGRGQVLRLDDHVGLHHNLTGLKGVWDDGALAVLQGVGYPNPNRSHFESTDIWHTAFSVPQGRWNGWLGRALDADPGRDVPGVYLDPGPLSLALIGESAVIPSIADASRFRVQGGNRVREALSSVVARPRSNPECEFIRRSAQQAYVTSDRVEAALNGRNRSDSYPQSALAQRLWQIARMVESGFPPRVYAVRLTGFDTHSRQRAAHDQLMRRLGDALGAFHNDLKAHGLSDRVLTVTYSEFGRRVKENRSLGTDHGAAAPMFVLGGGTKAGLHGAHPSLADLDDGDLKHHTDFRQVYATILQRWLNADARGILAGAYTPVAFL